VSQTKSQIQKSGPTIENISIGIAINKTAFDPGERESVTQLIAYATGVPADNVSVQNFRFSGTDGGEGTGGDGAAAEEGLNIWLLAAIGGGVLLLLIIGLVVLLLMKKKKKKSGGALAARRGKEEDREILNEIFGHPEQEIAHIVPVPDKKREEIKDFAKENPEIVAQMIKTLLRNEND
jgi:flagellar M-ring protein FliF